MLTLLALYNRRKKLNLTALGKSHNLVHHLVNRLSLNLLAAVRAVGNTDSGVEKSEVVINLCYGSHSGSGVLVGGFLVYGDGGRKALNSFHVGLLHLAQELSCVG